MMEYRDPKRIEAFIKKLKEYWLSFPDLRFGQLMTNFFEYTENRTGQDIFYIEDDKMKALLDEYFEDKYSESLFKS